MKFNENNSMLKGHWKLDVYQGDVKRKPLPLNQRIINRLLKTIGKSPKYVGEVLDKPIKTIEGDNLIVTVGKQMIMDRLFGLSAVGAMTRIGVGTSATAAAVGNTTLTGGVFVAYDTTPIRTSLTVTCTSTFGTGTANISWNELGMDNGTTLLNRIAPIGPFNKTSAVSIIVTVTITQA
jgi:hypothetical protein